MPTSKIIFENQRSKPLQFHVELNCTPFEIAPGKSVEISGDYQVEPIIIVFSDDEEFGIFGAVFPGDGDVIITSDGQVVARG